MRSGDRHILVLGLAGASVLAATFAGILFVSAGCSSPIVPPPDASSTKCVRGPIVFCDAGAPGPDSCTSAGSTDPLVSELPTTPFPVGCQANLLNGRIDFAGTCLVSAGCTCFAGDGGHAAEWACFGP